MVERKTLTIYWDTEEEGELMEKLEEVAKKEKRSKSAVVLVALEEYVENRLITE